MKKLSGKNRILLGLALLLAAGLLGRLLRKELESPSISPLASADPKCRAAYENFFGADPLKILVAFGYKDARPARFVGDRYERALFVQRVLAPCEPGEHACGFERGEEDADLFTKRIVGADGRKKSVELRIVHSSVGPDDQENRIDPHQLWRSDYARELFLRAIRDSAAVFYNGHSRAGGGPDFHPPELGWGQHVRYDLYRSRAQGLKEMTVAISDSKAAVKMMGMFSCASSQHFSGEILKAWGASRSSQTSSKTTKELGWISSSQLLYFADALESSLQALSALLGMKCQPEFEEALKARSPQAGTRLKGFF